MSRRARGGERHGGVSATGDPRPSIEERYTFSMFYWLTLNAIQDMVAKRLVLPEDAGTMFNARLQAALANNLLSTTRLGVALLLKAHAMTFGHGDEDE